MPQKNTKPFGGDRDGLLGIKLDQLLTSKLIDEIVVSTNDPVVEDIARRYANRSLKKFVIDRRPNHLCSSQTSTDELALYVPTIIKNKHILWTHITSPFVDSEDYDLAIMEYNEIIKGDDFDSLMSVTAIHNFLWTKTGPLNYDRKIEKWPRTQTLDAVYEVNSAMFICHTEIMTRFGDRVGESPRLWELDKQKSMDIDWEEDFLLAEKIFISDKVDGK